MARYLPLEHRSSFFLAKLMFGFHTLTALDNGAGGVYLARHNLEISPSIGLAP